MARTDPIADFMDDVASRGHEPSLAKATGTVRFEVVDGRRTERWLLTVTKGEVAVSRGNAPADVTCARRGRCSSDRPGKVNAMAALLRGAVHDRGRPELLVLVQRLLPGPRASRRKGRAAGSAGRRR